MDNQINLKIENIGPINYADININKINIIGGKNSTGKSTSSKILYCFLRTISPKSLDLALNSFISQLEELAYLRDELKEKNVYYFSKERSSYRPFNAFEELKHPKNYASKRKYITSIKLTSFENDKTIFYNEENTSFELLKHQYYNVAESLMEIIDKKNNTKAYQNNQSFQKFLKKIIRKINVMNEMINIIESESKLFEYTIKKILQFEFNLKNAQMRNLSFFGDKAYLYSEELDFKYCIDFKNTKFNMNRNYNIEDVFYLDSFSLFDYIDSKITEHTNRLIESIEDQSESEDLFDDLINDDIIKIEEEINDLIGGKIEYEKNEMIFKSNDKSDSLKNNTASGIKQIGIIQLLLQNRKLEPESFLIIDEPEVNLHPEWQVRFAGILVLLAKYLDITLYINTHSPLFINAIDAYSEYYDLDDETNYYLTEPSKVEGKYDINKIENDELFIIYDNLGKPYDFIDVIRIQNAYKDEKD